MRVKFLRSKSVWPDHLQNYAWVFILRVLSNTHRAKHHSFLFHPPTTWPNAADSHIGVDLPYFVPQYLWFDPCPGDSCTPWPDHLPPSLPEKTTSHARSVLRALLNIENSSLCSYRKGRKCFIPSCALCRGSPWVMDECFQ